MTIGHRFRRPIGRSQSRADVRLLTPLSLRLASTACAASRGLRFEPGELNGFPTGLPALPARHDGATRCQPFRRPCSWSPPIRSRSPLRPHLGRLATTQGGSVPGTDELPLDSVAVASDIARQALCRIGEAAELVRRRRSVRVLVGGHSGGSPARLRDPRAQVTPRRYLMPLSSSAGAIPSPRARRVTTRTPGSRRADSRRRISAGSMPTRWAKASWETVLLAGVATSAGVGEIVREAAEAASAQLVAKGVPPMARPGLEPGTPRFSVVCSTN
jgi:hypothetical protein